MKGARNRMALLVGAMVVVGAVQIIVIPKLDALTGGAIITRFQDTDPTGRDVLIKTELETFTTHPFFGTGPATLDEFEQHTSSSHTEFSRLLSQHGIFGVGALALMLVLALRAVTSQANTSAKAIAIALVSWSMLTMTHAAMRLGMTPLAFGMAAALYFAARPPTREGPAVEARA